MRAVAIGLTVGYGGWVRVTAEGRHWYGRAVEGDDGRLVLGELYAPGGVRDQFPVAYVETWINVPDVARDVRHRMNFPGPDLRRAATYFATNVFEQDEHGRGPHWCAEMLQAQHEGSPVPQAPMRPDRALRVQWAPVQAKVDCPAEPPYGDEFYARVALAHRWLVDEARRLGQRPAPAPAIARANGVPVTTAHKWIRVAKERGFITGD